MTEQEAREIVGSEYCLLKRWLGIIVDEIGVDHFFDIYRPSATYVFHLDTEENREKAIRQLVTCYAPTVAA